MAWRVATPVVGLLSGALFVVSAHSSEGTDLRPGRFTDLASMVRYDAARVDALKGRVADLNAQINLLSGSIGNKQVRTVSRRAVALRGPAGLVPETGPGVTVTLSDAPDDVASSSSVDPRLLIVHQQDIQAVVNAMWRSGARAVTVQGQRIVTTTGIRCIGNAVQLQGVPYSQPYVISAVGDPATDRRRAREGPLPGGLPGGRRRTPTSASGGTSRSRTGSPHRRTTAWSACRTPGSCPRAARAARAARPTAASPSARPPVAPSAVQPPGLAEGGVVDGEVEGELDPVVGDVGELGGELGPDETTIVTEVPWFWG